MHLLLHLLTTANISTVRKDAPVQKAMSAHGAAGIGGSQEHSQLFRCSELHRTTKQHYLLFQTSFLDDMESVCVKDSIERLI